MEQIMDDLRLQFTKYRDLKVVVQASQKMGRDLRPVQIFLRGSVLTQMTKYEQNW